MTHEQLVRVFGADGVTRASVDVAHEGTRSWLAEVGVPSEAAGFRLDLHPAGGLRSVEEHLDTVHPSVRDDEESTAPEPTRHAMTEVASGWQDLPQLPKGFWFGSSAEDESPKDRTQSWLVVGHNVDLDSEKVLLDGETGRIFVAYFTDRSPELFPELVASDLSSFTRLAATVQEFRTGQGEFARFAGRYGHDTAEQLTERLLAEIREHDPDLLETREDHSWVWHAAALVLPLARIATPGTDLTLELPDGLLAAEFEAKEITTFTDSDFPDALTHAPTRRVLRKVGLPSEAMFLPQTAGPLRTMWEHWHTDPDVDLPAGACGLIQLGYRIDDLYLVVEGATGRVLLWHPYESEPSAINIDISTFVFALWLVRRTNLLTRTHQIKHASTELADSLTEVLASVDLVACVPSPQWPFAYWPETFASPLDGILEAM